MNIVEMQDGKIRKKKNEPQVLDGDDEFLQEQVVGNQNMPGMQFEASMAEEVDGQKGKKKKKKKKKAIVKADDEDEAIDNPMGQVSYEEMERRNREKQRLEREQMEEE